MTFYYFAYGSNLLTCRLRQRTPSARVVDRAILRQHELRWHKAATDGSGKCDAVPVEKPDAYVMGVVYEIDVEEKPWLDAAETLGVGYAEKEVQVETPAGRLQARTYYALRTDPAAVPYDWYQALVVNGAREHALPDAYVRLLEAVPVKVDPDRERAARHFRLAAGNAPRLPSKRAE